jgi:hypothetical protein
MEVNIYIEFWTLEMKCTQHGLFEQATFKNARVRPGSGAEALAFFGVALVNHPNVCNTRRRYVERPLEFEPVTTHPHLLVWVTCERKVSALVATSGSCWLN